jgi:predicted transcriptional regulator
MVDKRVLSVIFLALILASTLSILTYGKSPSLSVGGEKFDGRYDPYYLLFLDQNHNASITHDDFATSQSARTDILLFVENNPGSHFRLICSSLGLCVGVVQYHVRRLEEDGLVSSKQFGRYRRFYKSKMFDSTSMIIISMLSIETVRRIVRVLLDEGSVRHSVLAERVGVSSQDLSWHMRRLCDAELVSSKVEQGLRYTINVDNQEKITRYLETQYA